MDQAIELICWIK